MKKLVIALMVLALVTSAVFANGAAEAGAGKKTVLNIMSFTDEVPGMVTKYFEMHPEEAAKYEVKTTIIATTDGLYQPALDEALKAGGAEAPDIYCAESAFVLKYAQGDMADYAATYKSLGIDVDKLVKSADIAQYTIDIGSRKGELVALGYQATGGAFIYNRTAAKKAFGTDDPAVVAEKIGAGTNSWDKFFETAAEIRKKGVAIVSGDGDIWHAVENSSDKGWIVDGKLYIDPKREAFIDLSKKLKDGDFHNDTRDWQEGWFADMKQAGAKPVLGFYGPAWLINYTIGQNCGDTYGDWGVCAPNIGFFWGGTWVFANKDTKNADIVAKIIKWITLDDSDTGLQYFWANGTLNGEGGTKDSVASGTVMAKSDGKLDFLKGQNMFDAFVPANQYANGKNLTQYDETINTYWRDQVRQYTAGTKTREQAIKDFKTQVKENLDVIVE